MDDLSNERVKKLERDYRRLLAYVNWGRIYGGCSMATHIGIWRDKRFKDARPEEN